MVPQTNPEFTTNRIKNDIQIRIAKTPKDIVEILKLRYKIYTLEMNRRQKWADHEHKVIYEPLDETAVLIGAYTPQGSLLGTCRMNFSQNCAFENRELYSFDHLEKVFGQKLVFYTKFMIIPELRHGFLFHDMVKALYSIAIEQGAEAGILDCNDHLIMTFRSLGFQPYKGKVAHPDLGIITPMLFDFFDQEYLKKCGSPLLSLLPKEEARSGKRNHVLQLLGENHGQIQHHTT